MAKISYFWETNELLSVNGVRLTPEEAYAKYPDHKDEIQKFVEKSKNPIQKLSHSVNFVSKNTPNLRPEQKQLKIEDIIVKLKEEISYIFKECGIDKNKEYDENEQFANAFTLFKYIIKHSKYDEKIMDEKFQTSDLYTMMATDIYRCLCEHKSVCTSDAAALSLLFEQAGINSRHITIAEKGEDPKGVHEVVSFNIAGKTYICDPTLTRTALESGNIPKIHPSIFAFTPNKFFELIYPTKEVKFEHETIKL